MRIAKPLGWGKVGRLREPSIALTENLKKLSAKAVPALSSRPDCLRDVAEQVSADGERGRRTGGFERIVRGVEGRA